jgi:hypothetical protein
MAKWAELKGKWFAPVIKWIDQTIKQEEEAYAKAQPRLVVERAPQKP